MTETEKGDNWLTQIFLENGHKFGENGSVA